MPNEYNGTKVVLRDTSGNQMSLPRFFQIGLVGPNGESTIPSQGWTSTFDPTHHAWDIATNGVIGVIPARCPVSGSVTVASMGYNGGAGNWVVVQEDTGGLFDRWHIFMHLETISVSVGDSVEQGTSVGSIGNTGSSYGAHLHYQVATANPEQTWRTSENPIDTFDTTTLPAGWNMEDASDAGNWNYIPLDTGGQDYGPPGGITPAEPFFPTTQCYDISWAQVVSGSLDACIDAIIASGSGGIILQVGAFRNTGFEPDSHFSPAAAVSRILSGGIGLGIYFYNYADYSQDLTTAFEDALTYLQTIGATKEAVNMGIWIDTEQGSSWDPTPSSDPAVNYRYVERFMNVFDLADYPVVGEYSSAGTFSIYPASAIGDKPIWAAYIPFTFDQADRSTLSPYLPENTYTKVYIFQHSWSGRVPGFNGELDCDKVLMPMPTVSGGGGGGGGEYTEVIKVTVDVIPPKRIYFSPNPGLLPADTDLLSDRQASIEITTDAENAILYYTIDGSSPYQYSYEEGTVVYALAANVLQYDDIITIYKDVHIRVIAVPEGTMPGDTFEAPLAKGSGTFLFEYRGVAEDWEEEQKSYATSDDNVSFFEENRQAFLRIHDEVTTEEILYADVYKHNTESYAEDATDNASSTGTAEPEFEPISGGDDDVSD